MYNSEMMHWKTYGPVNEVTGGSKQLCSPCAREKTQKPPEFSPHRLANFLPST